MQGAWLASRKNGCGWLRERPFTFGTPRRDLGRMSGSKRSRKVAFQEEVQISADKKRREDGADEREAEEEGRSECASIRMWGRAC